MAEVLGKPLPQPTSISRPFWQAAAQQRLVMQRCTRCNAYVWTPRAACFECGSEALEWQQLCGRGAVHSFTVIRQVAGRGASAAFAAGLPYVLALIDLEEGPRMLSNVIGCGVDDVVIDMRVDVVFEQASDTIWLPKFRPAP